MDEARNCESARVVRGVEPAQAIRVGELFYASFGEKLSGLVLPRNRDAAVAFLARSLCLDHVYAALGPDGKVLGIAFVTGGARVLCLKRDALVSAYGVLGGSLVHAVYRGLMRRPRAHPKDVRGLEGFSVDPDCRGRGIGTAMIKRIVDDARREGARAIELSVGDNNRARRLYERSGFVQTRTSGVGPFAKRLGFRRFVHYELALADLDAPVVVRTAE